MAEVSLAIHGKKYGIACDDGQENRVSELGRYVDTRLREIASAGATTNDSHLLVLTSLVLADEIYDIRAEMSESAAAPSEEQRVSEQEEKVILNAIHNLMQRIDTVSQRLEKI